MCIAYLLAKSNKKLINEPLKVFERQTVVSANKKLTIPTEPKVKTSQHTTPSCGQSYGQGSALLDFHAASKQKRRNKKAEHPKQQLQ
eukprot:3469554-Amphidinium_carterae.1